MATLLCSVRASATWLIGILVWVRSPPAQVLLFYGSTAVFVSTYRGDRASKGSDVNYVPRLVTA